jgi:large repetitive protein
MYLKNKIMVQRFLKTLILGLSITATFIHCDTVTNPDFIPITGRPLPSIMYVPSGGSALLDLTIAVNSASQVSISRNARRGLLNFEEGRFIRYSTQSPFFLNGEDTFILKIDGEETTIKVKIVTPKTNTINCEMGAFMDKGTTAINTPISINILENDTFCNTADLVTLRIVTQPKHGALTRSGSTLTFTPEKDFVGEDKIIYTISGRGFTQENSPAEVFFTVNDDKFCQNALNPDFYKWVSSTLTTSVILDVLDNDQLCKLTNFSLFIDLQPKLANAKIDNNKIVYTLNPNNIKTNFDELKYGVKDANGAIIYTTNVSINAICQLELNDDYAEWTASSGAYFPYRVLDNDTVCNANLSSLNFIKKPVNGTVDYRTSGIVFYTPNPNFKGLDSFRYTLNDEIGTLFSALAKIKVN